MACNVTYFDQNDKAYWKCPNLLGYQSPRPLSATKCWKYNCPGRKLPPPNLFCKSKTCEKLSRPGALYCSDLCRKRQNNRDYRERKKIKLSKE